jgi:hypothetical protein
MYITNADYNCCGISGEPDDFSIYSIDASVIEKHSLSVGCRVMLSMIDSDTESLVCEAVLEKYGDRWRANPVPGTWRTVLTADLPKA